MKKIFIGILFTFIAGFIYAQNVNDIEVKQVGKTIEISYSLDKKADITILLSVNGGKDFRSISKVTGDVGKDISAGRKKIVWDVLAEYDKFVEEDVVFRVKASLPYDIEMVFVQGGTFTMGCTSEQSDCYDREKPTHQVTLSDYYIGKYEVTQKQWKEIMGSYPSELYNTGCDECPVEKVSWNDVQEFIKKLNERTGKKYRLPTEAEWEYAARGGVSSARYKYSGSNNINDVAWYDGNYKNSKHGSQGTTHPIGTKKANELGIYDMSGNVWEWCSDWYGAYSSSSQTNPTGAVNGSDRVLRGGSWGNGAQGCGVSFRRNGAPSYRGSSIGFRLALVP